VAASFRLPFGERARGANGAAGQGAHAVDSTMLAMPDPGQSAATDQILRAGPYILERQLGAGGESHVWLASHAIDQTRAVVKTQRVEVFPERMRREAAILYALKSVKTPNVVQLLPSGEDGVLTHEPGTMRNWNGEQVQYCVMETLPCDSNQNLVKQAPLRGKVAAALFDGLRAALRVMHLDFDMIHNDLKPQNIVAWRDTPNGRLNVRIFDFGQAALLTTHPRAKNPCVTPEPALEYVYRFGSFPYMAPERWHGRTPRDGSETWLLASIVDDRTDQWSFAATVFELLTGRRLVNARSEEQFRRLITGGGYLAAVEDARLSAGVKAALRRALALSPADRYQRGPSISGLDFFCRDLEAALV
jgi:eukaryotic-like serine/threonine-protein kinase